ncbi:hypothetical protein HDV05_002532 [Chytridiales sp. JEL 0842]|nr:hypothetical protein HDV05_002532 [Chytridiales sp. JEL 0842]
MDNRGVYSSGRIPLRSLDTEAGLEDDDMEGDSYVFKEDLENPSAKRPRLRAFAKLDRSQMVERIRLLVRNPVVLVSALIMMLMTIVVLSITTKGPGADDGIPRLKPFTIDMIGAQEFKGPSMARIKWIDGARDGSYAVLQDNKLLVKHVDKHTSHITLVTKEDLPDLINSPYKISSDLKYILFETNHKKGWRHSFYADYYIYDVTSKNANPLTRSTPTKNNPEDIGSGLVGLTLWSPIGHSVAWVRDNDVYITVDGKTEVRITSDGSADIINGIADWVYEEEVLASHDAMWFSPDSTKLAYLKFNETLVPDVRLQQLAVSQYPKDVTLKYPKAGAPNPVVSLHIANPSAANATMRSVPVLFKEEDTFKDDDRLIVEVKWATANDTLLVRLMNRVQDAQRLFIVNEVGDGTWSATKVRDEKTADGAWFTNLQPITVIYPPNPTSNLPIYLELTENTEGYTHISFYTSLNATEPQGWLTTGPWEVTKILAVDVDRQLVYFLSTEQGSTQRHLYSVPLTITPSPKISKMTPPTGIEWTSSMRTFDFTGWTKLSPAERSEVGVGEKVGEVGYYGADFSPKCDYYLLSYYGPDIPFQKLVGVKDKASDTFLGKAKDIMDTSETFKQHAMPRQLRTSVTLHTGDEVNVHIQVPYDFDPTSKTKYPCLFKVYGGPNSQTVTNSFDLSFETGLAASNIITISVDPRGTGFKGRKFRTIVSKNLGAVEAEDIIEVAKYLLKLGFVDERRLAIWGWSFGGFLTGKVIEKDSGVFKVGMAVAPVTDWRFYDSIYTERYMKTPLQNTQGYETSAIANMSGFDKSQFLLVHGTFDDNVHFQNSAFLVWRFLSAHIRNYRTHFFPDSDHSMGAGGALGEMYHLLRDFMVDNDHVTSFFAGGSCPFHAKSPSPHLNPAQPIAKPVGDRSSIFTKTLAPALIMPNHPDEPERALLGSLCSNCFKSPKDTVEPLKRCAACEFTKYCSRSCQQEHWESKGHKKYCKQLQDLEEMLREHVEPLKKEGEGILVALRRMDEGVLDEIWKRKGYRDKHVLASWAYRYITYLARCDVCQRCRLDNLINGDGEKEGLRLTGCRECGWGWRCKDHKEEVESKIHTPEVCAKYQFCKRIEDAMVKYAKGPGSIKAWSYPPMPSSKGLDTFPISGWHDYYRWRGVDSSVDFDSDYMVIRTYSLSKVLTVAYALKHLYTSKTLPTTITIHILCSNGDGIEKGFASYWVELLHMFSCIKQLSVVYIGEDCKTESSRSMPLAGDRQLTITWAPNLTYVQYRFTRNGKRAREMTSPPTLAVWFQCEIHDCSEIWKEDDAKLLLKEGTPLVLTSSSEEDAENDMMMVREYWYGKVVVGPVKNPYGCRMVSVNYEDVLRPANSFFALNERVALVKGMSKDRPVGEMYY